VYIVFKGEFELSRRLPTKDDLTNNYLLPRRIQLSRASKFGKEREWLLPRENVLACRMDEVQDLPREQKLAILGEGALAGEEDVISRPVYSCDLTCKSSKGILFQISRENFGFLKNNDEIWLQVLNRAVEKEQRLYGAYLKADPLPDVKWLIGDRKKSIQ
jgi:CRP-like cAMP-binding protein